jgi:hypothetical protein
MKQVHRWNAKRVYSLTQLLKRHAGIQIFPSRFLEHSTLYWLGAWVAQSVQPLARTGRPRLRCWSPGRIKNFRSSKPFGSLLELTQPPIQLVPEALILKAMRSGREADHSSPTIAEVKIKRIYTSTSHTSP